MLRHTGEQIATELNNTILLTGNQLTTIQEVTPPPLVDPHQDHQEEALVQAHITPRLPADPHHQEEAQVPAHITPRLLTQAVEVPVVESY